MRNYDQSVSRDDAEAIERFRQAAEQGHSEAEKALKEMTGQ